MTLIILGLIIWTAAHFFKRLMPAQRQALQDRLGDGSKGVVAVILLLAIVLMVIGYRGAEGSFFWGRTAATTGINNLLMLLAVVLFGLGSSKSRFRAKLRHPMLMGVFVWAVAHILVNGDTPSLVLFGGMAVWALVQMRVVNRAVPDYVPFEGGSVAGDVRLLVISLVVFTVFSGIHIWLGYNPFGA